MIAVINFEPILDPQEKRNPVGWLIEVDQDEARRVFQANGRRVLAEYLYKNTLYPGKYWFDDDTLILIT